MIFVVHTSQPPRPACRIALGSPTLPRPAARVQTALRLAPGRASGAAALPSARGKSHGRGVCAGGWRWGAPGGHAPEALAPKGRLFFLSATPDKGDGFGIFVGPDPMPHKVIAVGDPMFGSAVTFVHMSGDSLNVSGRLTLFAGFGDGSRRILRADPEFSFAVNERAQLTTAEGTGVRMFQRVDLPLAPFDLSFDVQFPTETGVLSLMLGGVPLGVTVQVVKT